jgi:chemotaxis protein CheC
MLRRSLKTSLPKITRGKGPESFSLAPPPEAGDVVMFLYIDFTVWQRDISRHIAMLVDMPSLATLKTPLGEFIERETGGTAPYSDAPA